VKEANPNKSFRVNIYTLAVKLQELSLWQISVGPVML